MAEQQVLIPEVLDPEFAPSLPNSGQGRPQGARSRRHRFLQALAQDHMPQILEVVIRAALSGDMLACKLVMDRTWPRPRTAPVEVPGLLPERPGTNVTELTPTELRQAMADTFQRTTRGDMAAEDGAAIIAMLKDMLHANAIQAIEPPEAAADHADPRDLLYERLVKLSADNIGLTEMEPDGA